MRWWRSVPDRTPAWLTARPYAHRGLHGAAIVENSAEAFEAAIARGFGIELDVRPARCGTPIVFHDADLERLCGIEGRLADLGREDLRKVRLTIGQPVLALDEALDLIAGAVPVLVEIKSDRFDDSYWRRIAEIVDSHAGATAIMSFDPRPIRWFAAHAAEPIRGLVISDEDRSKFKSFVKNALALRLARPDFLAYDVRCLPASLPTRWRRSGRPLLGWTARRDEDSRHVDQIIFEEPR